MPETHPVSAEEWFAKGNACVSSGEFNEALACFEQLISMRPLDPAVYNNLGSTLVRLKRFSEAVERYRQAARLAPDSADIQHNLGCTLEQLRWLDQAVVCYREAVRLNPRLDGSWNNLANCLQGLGQFQAAEEAYRQAILIAPEVALYYRNIAQCSFLKLDDPVFASMERLLQQVDSLRLEDQGQLQFAYGQVLAENGLQERSFAHLLKANGAYRQTVRYDEQVTLGVLAHMPVWVSADVVKSARQKGAPEAAPIFVVGMPRSGSTLIEQILASHPALLGAGERQEFGLALVEAMTPGRKDRAAIEMPTLSDATPAQLRALGEDYLCRIATALPKAERHRRVVDKYPYNFINIGLIHLALPNARFIHSRRSPLDTCLSIFSRIFHDVPFAYDLGELGRYYRAYDELMKHWQRVLPDGVMLEVDYEDLVEDFEGTTRKMIAHCGLDWDDRCLRFHETERQVTTASATQVRQPLYRTSLQRWRPARELLEPLYAGLGWH
jgi:tetratricopeptide (TPR) repeat protein